MGSSTLSELGLGNVAGQSGLQLIPLGILGFASLYLTMALMASHVYAKSLGLLLRLLQAFLVLLGKNARSSGSCL